jgi:hypothetical protein
METHPSPPWKEIAMEAGRRNGASMIVVATDRQNVLERI